MKKDIQIFLGIQFNGEKMVVNKFLSIEQYNLVIDKKSFLNEALNTYIENLKDELKKKDLL